MKKLFMAPILALVLFLSSVPCANAEDVWVDYWANRDVQVYLQGYYANIDRKTGTIYMRGHIKLVRNGQLISRDSFGFEKEPGKHWMTIDGPRVYAPNKLFEYCAKGAGISYTIYTEDGRSWYY